MSAIGGIMTQIFQRSVRLYVKISCGKWCRMVLGWIINQLQCFHRLVPKVSGDEEVKQATQNWANSETEIRKNGPVALTDKQFGKTT